MTQKVKPRAQRAEPRAMENYDFREQNGILLQKHSLTLELEDFRIAMDQ